MDQTRLNVAAKEIEAIGTGPLRSFVLPQTLYSAYEAQLYGQIGLLKALWDRLGITTTEQLEAACREGKIAGLDGFGEKTQAKLLEGIAFKRQYASRHLLSDALLAADVSAGDR